MQDKKYHDGGHLNPQNRRGNRNHNLENMGEHRKEHAGKHSHTQGNQRPDSGKADEWPSHLGKGSTENYPWGNQRNFQNRESNRESGKPGHWRDSREVHASKHRQNPDHQRQHGHYERSSADERSTAQARNSTEYEENSTMENQSDVHGRESDRDSKPVNEGWTEVPVHASKHKAKPGIQRQYGGNGDERAPRRDRKNRWKENEKDHDYQGEKNNEKESNEWSRGKKNKNSGGERRHLPNEKHKYEYFWRNHSVFSQWYLSDFEVDGIKFNCTEKYMMYHKASKYVFSSPEPKAQVSFSDHNLPVVVVVVVNFSHFHLLLQNYLTNFNQTLHKASLGDGDSSLFK